MTPKAGYRFVPIVPNLVVTPPIAFADIDLSRPNPSGSVSGTLHVTWTADTPVCVGGKQVKQKDESTKVEAVRFGNRFCLPGSTLRGMVRSVLEIEISGSDAEVAMKALEDFLTGDEDETMPPPAAPRKDVS